MSRVSGVFLGLALLTGIGMPVAGAREATQDAPAVSALPRDGVRLAQAAGPTTAGGTLPYLTTTPASPAEPADAPSARPQSPSSTGPAPAAATDLAEPAQPLLQPVKKLIDPNELKKPAKDPVASVKPTPAVVPPAPVAATPVVPPNQPAPAPQVVVAPTASPSIETIAPKPAVAPAAPPAGDPGLKALNETAGTTPVAADPKPASETAAELKKKKPARKTSVAKTTEPRVVHEHPVYAEDEVRGPRYSSLETADPVPPRPIGRQPRRGEERLVRRERPVEVQCHTYIIPGLFFNRREVRCP